MHHSNSPFVAGHIELPPDVCANIFQRLDCLHLVRALLVSKSWKALAQSEALWERVCIQEFGVSASKAIPKRGCSKFQHLRGCPQGWNASLQTKFAAALDSIASWKLHIHCKHNGAEGPLAVEIPPARYMVNRQSVWITFPLPQFVTHGTADSEDGDAFDLRVVAERHDGAEVVLISSLSFSMPESDMERMLQSHTEGLYAWEEEGSSESEDSDDEQGDGAPQGRLAWLAAYIHFEQLLPLWPHPLPQALPTKLLDLSNKGVHPPSSLSPPSSPTSSSSIHLLIDFGNIRTGQLLGNCRVALARRQGCAERNCYHCRGACACSVFSTIRDELTEAGDGECGLLDFNVAQEVAAAAAAAASTSSQHQYDEGSVSERMGWLLDQECLLDFAIFDSDGALLIGRSGVEIWRQEETSPDGSFSTVVYRASFLVDGVVSGMRANNVFIRPDWPGMELVLCEEAAQRLLSR